MTSKHVQAVMDGLCNYYTDRAGQPRLLNTTQTAVYAALLGKFDHAQLQAAAEAWMRQSAFFPAASDLLKLLAPPMESAALAQLAWATVERAIRIGGIYQGAHFPQGAIGEAVRQVFGTWMQACSFDLDSPGWAIRRQSFLAIFPALVTRDLPAVTLRGLHANGSPYVVPLIEGMPTPLAIGSGDEPLTLTEGRALLTEATRRADLRSPTGRSEGA